LAQDRLGLFGHHSLIIIGKQYADDSVVQGGILTFAQGVDGCNIPACRGVFYAGKFPPVVS